MKKDILNALKHFGVGFFAIAVIVCLVFLVIWLCTHATLVVYITIGVLVCYFITRLGERILNS